MSDVSLSTREQEKFNTVNAVLKKKINNGCAAKILGVSVRQIKRLKKAVREQGKLAVVHRLKGKPSNRRLNENLKKKTLETVTQKYSDFKPAFASEKLKENENITVNAQTLRRWMIEAGLWKVRRKKKTEYRAWRARREYFGELEQFDGSYHYWFENRYCDAQGNPIEVCILASIDDATGKITHANFSANEGVVAVFNFWKQYVKELGKPLAIYLDKFSTYKINHKGALDNQELMTQFQRAMQNLNIQLITAHSPEAKGRIERLFGTLQDRLVKELRLGSISTPEEANKYLEDVFIPKFNEKFSVTPIQEGDLHRQLNRVDRKNFNRVFSIQSTRKIKNDFTIQFKNNWYQLSEIQPTTIRARTIILVEEHLNETIHFSFREHYLNYMFLAQRPKKTKKVPTILTTHKLNWKPPDNHPWKKVFYKSRY